MISLHNKFLIACLSFSIALTGNVSTALATVMSTTRGSSTTTSVKTISAPELNSLTPGTITGETYTVSFDANGSYFKYHEKDFKIASGTDRVYTASSTSSNASGNTVSVTYKIPSSEVLYGYMSYPENYNGKHCIGWNTVSDATVAAANLEVSDYTTLYAVWEDDTTTPTMNYNVNLGQWSGYLLADRNNRRTAVDVNLELQKPTREGYNFIGWYYDPQNPVDTNKWSESMGLTKYDQVFAVWEPIGDPYTITFDAHGGTIDGASIVTVNVPRGSTGTFTSETPTRTGYTFKGWSKSSTAESGDMSITIDRATVTADVYYYATWLINSSDPVEPDPDPVIVSDNTPIKTWYIGSSTLTDVKADIYNDGRLVISGTGSFSTTDAANAWLSTNYRSSIKSVTFKGDLEPTNLSGAFTDATSLETVNLGEMDFSNCTSTKNMFKGCKKLTSFNGSAYVMPKLADMSGMFDGCKKLSSLSLPYSTTGSLRTMDRAFADCKSLTSLDFGNLNTKFVTSMKELCSGDDSLSTINVSTSFAVPSSSYVSYGSNGKLFVVDTTETIPLTITGQMSKTLSTYATTKFTSDHRSLDYDKDANMVNVTFDYNYPDGMVYSTKQYCNSGETVVKPATPTAQGYTFQYWALSGEEFNFSTPINDNITLTAVWKQEDNVTGKMFTVTFLYDGKEFSKQSVSGYSTVGEIAGPGKTETHEFKCWSLTENGDPYNFTTQVTADMKLYAVMKRRSDVHIVTFNYNGGKYKSKTSTSVNVADGHKVKKPNYKPKSSGEKFKGWYESSDAEDKWDFSTKIYEDITIYAGWSDGDDDDDDDDNDSNDEDSTEDGTTGDAFPNIFDQLLGSMFASPSENTTSELTSISAGSIPKTGTSPQTQAPLAILGVAVLVLFYIFYRRKIFHKHES